MNIIDPDDCEWSTLPKCDALRHKSNGALICDIAGGFLSCDAYFYFEYGDYNNFIPDRFDSVIDAKKYIDDLIQRIFKLKAFI